MRFSLHLFVLALVFLTPGFLRAAEKDIVVGDFEGENYGDWKTTGTAFGIGPGRGTLPGQMEVTGYLGKGLVNSFFGGDPSTGTLTSPEFKVERKYISFLIGGGGFPGKTCINLLIDGKVIRTATGPNNEPGGSERLEPDGWDVGEWAGKTARIEIVDEATCGWGHINVDQIVFTDQKPRMFVADAARDITIPGRFLFFPVKTGATPPKVRISIADQVERAFHTQLTDRRTDQ